MKKNLLSVVMMAMLPVVGNAAMPFVGTYQTIDDETNLPKSIVQIYEYQDDNNTEIAGRIIALYNEQGEISETLKNPTRIADKVDGAPNYVGLDIIWDMRFDTSDNEYSGGKIMDPKSGKVYSSVIWQEKDGQLNVRGKIGPFGRTQHWFNIDNQKLPSELHNLDISTWTPVKH
jgi:uncharacterized protein (DUF2147 family)